jgi:flagellar basal body-associated protein FliL
MGGGKSVNPMTIVVSIVGLLVALVVIYFYTFSRSPQKSAEESPVVSTPPPAAR